jgi:tetratricopeptide (TPR) repeat protein
MQKTIQCLWIFVFAVLLARGLPGNTPGQSRAAEEENTVLYRLYLGADFSQIIRYFEKKDFHRLSQTEKLVFIECLARTGRGLAAEEKSNPLLASHPSDPGVLAAAGAVALSLGRLEETKNYIGQALEREPEIKQALLSKVLLLLYRRDFNAAQNWYEKLVTVSKNSKSPWAESDLLFLVGVDVYRASQDTKKLSRLHKAHAVKKKKINRTQHVSLNADYRMHKHTEKHSGGLFRVETPLDKAVVPFTQSEKKAPLNIVSLTAGGKTFSVLLDTGNAAGLLVHSRELNELLKPVGGGRTITMIGTESGFLDGYRHYYKVLDFDTFKILHVNGIYVPKPRPYFHDANLNPSFIQNRVVTIDFIKNEMILRTKERFSRDLASQQPNRGVSRLPWYGYKFAFVPLTVMGEKEKEKKGLAVIETGAQDIALKLDFVQGLLTLNPRVKYLASGQVTHYHQSPVTLLLGDIRFTREAADVWPFSRFYNHLTGLSADVVIGPEAFRGKYAVSFDPFDNRVVLEKAGCSQIPVSMPRAHRYDKSDLL